MIESCGVLKYNDKELGHKIVRCNHDLYMSSTDRVFFGGLKRLQKNLHHKAVNSEIHLKFYDL